MGVDRENRGSVFLGVSSFACSVSGFNRVASLLPCRLGEVHRTTEYWQYADLLCAISEWRAKCTDCSTVRP